MSVSFKIFPDHLHPDFTESHLEPKLKKTHGKTDDSQMIKCLVARCSISSKPEQSLIKSAVSLANISMIQLMLAGKYLRILNYTSVHFTLYKFTIVFPKLGLMTFLQVEPSQVNALVASEKK